jgi:hypothetical protein
LEQVVLEYHLLMAIKAIIPFFQLLHQLAAVMGLQLVAVRPLEQVALVVAVSAHLAYRQTTAALVTKAHFLLLKVTMVEMAKMVTLDAVVVAVGLPKQVIQMAKAKVEMELHQALLVHR